MRRVASIALILATCLAAPAAAQAVTRAQLQNQRADRVALNAYAAYLQALLANKAAAKLQEQAFASATSATCRNALEPIAAMSSVPGGWSTALTNIGEEIGGDATVEFIQTAQPAFMKLAATLSTLRWVPAPAGTITTPGSALTNPAATVRRFVNAESALLTIQPSNLCGDALEVAANTGSQTMSTPAGTQAFLNSYALASGTANTRLGAFLRLLDAFETSNDKVVVTKINSAAKKVTSMSADTIASATSVLKGALGIAPGSSTRDRWA